MTTVEIRLPRLAGTRDAARQLVDKAGLDESGVAVFLSARLLTTGTVSFADELIKDLQERGVASVTMAGSPARFEQMLKTAAARRRYGGLRIATDSDLVGA